MATEKITDLYLYKDKDTIVRPNVVNENLPQNITINQVHTNYLEVEQDIECDGITATNASIGNNLGVYGNLIVYKGVTTKDLTASGDIHLTNPHIQGALGTSYINSTNLTISSNDTTFINDNGTTQLKISDDGITANDLSVNASSSTFKNSNGDNQLKISDSGIEFSYPLKPTEDKKTNIGTSSKSFSTIYCDKLNNGKQQFIKCERDSGRIQLDNGDYKMYFDNNRIEILPSNSSGSPHIQLPFGRDNDKLCFSITKENVGSPLDVINNNTIHIISSDGGLDFYSHGRQKMFIANDTINCYNISDFNIKGIGLVSNVEYTENITSPITINNGTGTATQSYKLNMSTYKDRKSIERNITLMFELVYNSVHYRISDVTLLSEIDSSSIVVPFYNPISKSLSTINLTLENGDYRELNYVTAQYTRYSNEKLIMYCIMTNKLFELHS